MKKSVLLFLSISLFLLSGCKAEAAYKKEYGQVLKEIASVMDNAAYYRDQITDVWSTAIHDNQYKKYGNDKYCYDFNDALGWYFIDRSKDAQFNDFENSAKGLTTKVKELNDYPSKLEDAYDELVDLVAMVNEFCKNVSSPEGSLQNYSSSTYQNYQDISQHINKLEIKYTEWYILPTQHPNLKVLLTEDVN